MSGLQSGWGSSHCFQIFFSHLLFYVSLAIADSRVLNLFQLSQFRKLKTNFLEIVFFGLLPVLAKVKHNWSKCQTFGLLTVYFVDCYVASFAQGGDNQSLSVPVLILTIIMAVNFLITAESLPILPLLTHDP